MAFSAVLVTMLTRVTFPAALAMVPARG